MGMVMVGFFIIVVASFAGGYMCAKEKSALYTIPLGLMNGAGLSILLTAIQH